MNQVSQQARIDRYRRGRSTQVVNLRLPEPFTHSPQPFTREMLQVTVNVARDDTTKKIPRGDRVRTSLAGPRVWGAWEGGAGPSRRVRRCVWRPPRRQACAPPSTICRQRSPRSERTRGRRVRPARTRKLRPNNRTGEVSSEPDQEIQLCIWCPAPTWSWTFERKSNDDSKQKPDA